MQSQMAHKGDNGQSFVWFFLLLDSYVSLWLLFTLAIIHGFVCCVISVCKNLAHLGFFFFDTTGTSGLVSHSQEHVENEFLLVELTTRLKKNNNKKIEECMFLRCSKN